MPRFSIIIPVFNAEAYLKESIESVINQTNSDWELIIVNDGSTDESANRIADLTNEIESVKVINQENQGLGAARNTASKHASGEWLVFLDADDYWAANKLAEVAECIEMNPEAEVIYHPIMEMRPNGLIRRRSFWEVSSTDDLVQKGNPLVPSAMAIKRDVFEKYGGFIEYRDQVEDLLLWFRLFEGRTKFKIHKKPLTVYRIGAGVTANLEDHLSKTFKAVETAVDDGIFPKQVEIIFKQRKYYEAARQLHKLGNFDEAKTYYEKAKTSDFKSKLLAVACRLKLAI